MERLVGTEPTIPRRAGVQRNRHNVDANTPEEYIKRAITIPFMDNLVVELGDRFSEESRNIQAIMALVPEVFCSFDAERIRSTAKQLMFWRDDLPEEESLVN